MALSKRHLAAPIAIISMAIDAASTDKALRLRALR
jgi:hypothetical protein